MKNRINTTKSRLCASHELYSVVKDQDYRSLVIDARIDTFGVSIILIIMILICVIERILSYPDGMRMGYLSA